MSKPVAWFYVHEGKRQGPVDLETLLNKIFAQEVSQKALVWHEGLAEWVQAESLPEIATGLPPPPPMPSVAAAAEPRDIDSTKESSVVAQTQNEGAERGVRPRTPNRFDLVLIVGIALSLLTAGGFTVLVLLSGPQILNPKVAEKMVAAALWLGFAVAIVVGLIPALRRRFLGWFLVLFFLPSLVSVIVLLTTTREQTKVAAHMRDTVGYMESLLQGAKNGQPETGKTLDPDNPMAGFMNLVTDLYQDIDSMNAEIDATGAIDTFDLGMLSNKPQLREQLKILRKQKEIILRYQKIVMAKTDSWKLDLSKSGLSPEYQAAIRAGDQGGSARGRLVVAYI